MRLTGLSVGLLVVCLIFAGCAPKATTKNKDDIKGVITISGAWALYPMTVKWAEEFQKLHPSVRIDIAAGGAGKGMADCLVDVVDIGMVSRSIYPEEINKGAFDIAVAKDAVVPTLNAGNPLSAGLLSRGITREEFINLWVKGTITNWGQLIKKSNQAISIYTRSDACGAAQTWAEYLGGAQEDLLGVGVYGDPGIAEAVKKDTYGIGYNNINYAYDSVTRKEVQGIRIVPIDLNGNGLIDNNEAFYKDLDSMVKAIADGLYPSPPARELHFVCHGKPVRNEVKEFVRWVLTDGQKYVEQTGYINLSKDKLNAEVKQLGE